MNTFHFQGSMFKIFSCNNIFLEILEYLSNIMMYNKKGFEGFRGTYFVHLL